MLDASPIERYDEVINMSEQALGRSLTLKSFIPIRVNMHFLTPTQWSCEWLFADSVLAAPLPISV
jgi:hypothetical protein